MKKTLGIVAVLLTGLAAGVFITLFVISKTSDKETEYANADVLSETSSENTVTETAPTESTINTLSETHTETSTYSSAAETISETASTASSEMYPQWDSNAVYNGGDKIVYQNKIYRAKWWTQGETPDIADVWEDTLEAPVAVTEAVTSSATVTAAAVNTDKDYSVPDNFKIVGYYPSWKPGAADKIRYDVLTHINYAFAIPDENGGLRPLENADTALSIIKNAHASDCKVLLAVGGWSYNDVPLESTFMSATETEEKRSKLINEIVNICEKYSFDGIDIDWEHPRTDGTSSKQYESFMTALSEQLHQRGKLLTSAVISGATADGNIYYDAAAHTDKVLNAVDWINVMAYDGGDGERHSSYEFAVNSGKYWHETRGLSSEKVVLGVPFYARPSWESYDNILSADANARNSDTSVYNGMEVWYNGPDTIRKKTAYALDNLGGIMIWEITQDTADKEKSLLSAIAETVSEQR